MKRDAFTLVEILVVIAVIALLLMIMMPSYQHAAAMTRATLCRNNLAKLSTAFATHAGGIGARTVKAATSLPSSDLWPGVPYDVCPVNALFICPEKEYKSGYSMPTKPLDGLTYACTNRNFELPITEVGIGGLHFGTRRGKDSRGDYIELVLEDIDVTITNNTFDYDDGDGLMRVYMESTGKVVIKLMNYSCGEHNCMRYRGKPLFPDEVTNPADPLYGFLGPGASKVGREVALSQGMQCSYGINERSGELRYGTGRVLLVDYDKMIVDLSDANCPQLLSTAAQRHLGKLNMLLTDGAVRATGPTQIDPLLGGQELWEP
jgi:prepilin-type N-terminal cleavage/methylation domain-containing protein